jgi:AcrR family transcriptional regulator
VVRSRQALCEAYLDLVHEGILQPGAEQIAGKAGLSRRSVFHHFKNLAALYAAAAEIGMERGAPFVQEIPPNGPVEDRLAALVDGRSRFLEATAPFARAMTARTLVGPAPEHARQAARESQQMQWRQVEAVFRKELESLSTEDRSETLEAMSAVTSSPMWEHLRRRHGLPMSAARSVMAKTLAALLRDAGIDVPKVERAS